MEKEEKKRKTHVRFDEEVKQRPRADEVMKDLELQMDLSESAGTAQTDQMTELRYKMEEGHIEEEELSQLDMQSESRSGLPKSALEDQMRSTMPQIPAP